MTYPFPVGKLRADPLNDAIAFGRTLSAIKSVAETVNNSSTLQNDDALSLPIAVGTYLMKQILVWASPAAADLKFDWTTPAGSSGWWTVTAPTLGSGASAPYLGALSWASLGTLEGGLYADNFSVFTGILIVTTAGTLQFRWAQNTATVGDSIVRANSGLFLNKV